MTPRDETGPLAMRAIARSSLGHRATSLRKRELVVVFLTRDVVWCAKTRRFGRLRNALDLLTEVAHGSLAGKTAPAHYAKVTRIHVSPSAVLI